MIIPAYIKHTTLEGYMFYEDRDYDGLIVLLPFFFVSRNQHMSDIFSSADYILAGTHYIFAPGTWVCIGCINKDSKT